MRPELLVLVIRALNDLTPGSSLGAKYKRRKPELQGISGFGHDRTIPELVRGEYQGLRTSQEHPIKGATESTTILSSIYPAVLTPRSGDPLDAELGMPLYFSHCLAPQASSLRKEASTSGGRALQQSHFGRKGVSLNPEP